MLEPQSDCAQEVILILLTIILLSEELADSMSILEKVKMLLKEKEISEELFLRQIPKENIQLTQIENLKDKQVQHQIKGFLACIYLDVTRPVCG